MANYSMAHNTWQTTTALQTEHMMCNTLCRITCCVAASITNIIIVILLYSWLTYYTAHL